MIPRYFNTVTLYLEVTVNVHLTVTSMIMKNI
nr:MAG TPA: hypothetical protein [Bacteriophage sp.]